MSAVIGFLKLIRYGNRLKYKASDILSKLMGKKSFEMIWEPLFINKFGNAYNNIP